MDSIVYQYPSMWVHIVGFRVVQNQANILQLLGGLGVYGFGVGGS